MNNNEFIELLDKAIASLEERFTSIQTGRANPKLLDNVVVEYYGVDTPLKQLANISVVESRTLMIKPFDKGALANIEKGIYQADIGLTPNNDGETIRITIPDLTEERRKELSKQAKELSEEAKISVRNIRKDEINRLEKEDLSEDEVEREKKTIQETIEKYNKKIDEKLEAKQKELMEF